MSQPIKSISKISRSLGESLFLKGARDDGPKSATTRRPYPPGQHGQNRRSKPSDYSRQLKEKQKLRYLYNLSETQLRKLITIADRSKENTSRVLLQMLESRIDNVMYVTGYAESRRHARQLVSHRHVKINGQKVSIPSLTVTPKTKISVSTKGTDTQPQRKRPDVPSWLDVDKKANEITVVSLPTPNEAQSSIDAQLIIEYYSRLM